MPVTPFPSADAIRITFEAMFRTSHHRSLAVRLTCRELGLMPDVVLDAVASRHFDADLRASS
jgi:hypothetical protein